MCVDIWFGWWKHGSWCCAFWARLAPHPLCVQVQQPWAVLMRPTNASAAVQMQTFLMQTSFLLLCKKFLELYLLGWRFDSHVHEVFFSFLSWLALLPPHHRQRHNCRHWVFYEPSSKVFIVWEISRAFSLHNLFLVFLFGKLLLPAHAWRDLHQIRVCLILNEPLRISAHAYWIGFAAWNKKAVFPVEKRRSLIAPSPLETSQWCWQRWGFTVQESNKARNCQWVCLYNDHVKSWTVIGWKLIYLLLNLELWED